MKIAREVLAEAGFDPNLVAPRARGPRREARQRPRPATRAVNIIDFTGSTEFGDWLEAQRPQATVYTEKAGAEHRRGRLDRRLRRGCAATSASRCPCTAGRCARPHRTSCVPAAGIATEQGHKSFDEVAAGIAAAIGALTARSGPG